MAGVAAGDGRAPTAGEALVAADGVLPIALPATVKLGVVPVSLAVGVALRAAVALPSGAADVVAVVGGEATLTPVVVAAVAAPVVIASLVLAERVGVAGVAIHVSRRGVAPPRPTVPSHADDVAFGVLH